MKYLYIDRYVGNRRSNRDDEFVGNGEIEREGGRGRSVVRSCTRGGRDFASGKTKDPVVCAYIERRAPVGKGGSRTPSKGSPTFLIKSTLAKRVAPAVALRAVENSCLRGAVRLNNCIDACNITGGY